MNNTKTNGNNEVEILKMDEVKSSSIEDLTSSFIISGVLLPIVNTLASPYYKTKLMDTYKEVSFNRIIANERKYREVIELLRDLSMHDKLTPSVEAMIQGELQALREELQSLSLYI